MARDEQRRAARVSGSSTAALEARAAPDQSLAAEKHARVLCQALKGGDEEDCIDQQPASSSLLSQLNHPGARICVNRRPPGWRRGQLPQRGQPDAAALGRLSGGDRHRARNRRAGGTLADLPPRLEAASGFRRACQSFFLRPGLFFPPRAAVSAAATACFCG